MTKDDLEEATRWIEGLDRLHKTRRLKRCFDLSATPYAPTGKKTTEEALFPWILSDFSLNDAIEVGLVKTPRVVVRDDALPVKWKGQDFRPSWTTWARPARLGSGCRTWCRSPCYRRAGTPRT